MHRQGRLLTIAFVIFGLKRRDSDHGPAMPAHCERCRNDVFLHPYGWRTWFHIFWIPLIPWTATRTLTCPVCAEGIEISEPSYERSIEISKLAEAAADGRSDGQEFWTAVDDADEIYAELGHEPSQERLSAADAEGVALDEADVESRDSGAAG